MENISPIIGDSIVVLFDLLIYTRMTKLKKDTLTQRILMYLGCTIILIAYFMSVYVFDVAPAMASTAFMTIPSFVLFWFLSEYKDARFVVTFCFVDTVTLIIAFLSRTAGILAGTMGSLAGAVATFVLFMVIYLKCRPYFPKYRELLESVPDGWIPMMISTIMIYILMIFTASYPKPMLQRTEYFVTYGVLSATIISFYAVFIIFMVQKKSIHDLNRKYQRERQWHRIAYIDVLTGLKNRMAYMEHINELERSGNNAKVIHTIMIDIDNFKKINDTLGHHMGDTVLKRTADFLNSTFYEDNYEIFRIGGDEFAIIAIDTTIDDVNSKIDHINEMNVNTEVGCTLSFGCSTVIPEQHNALENAFIRAGSVMNENKKFKKAF